MLGTASKEESEVSKATRGKMSPKLSVRPLAVRTPSGSGRHYKDLAQKTRSSPDNFPHTPGHSPLSKVDSVELLEQDERPTFILDMNDPANAEIGPLKLVFANTALKSRSDMLDQVVGRASSSSSLPVADLFTNFKKWATRVPKERETSEVLKSSFSFGGAVWTCSSLQKHMRVYKAYYQSSPFTPRGHPASFLNKENENNVNQDTSSKEPQDYFGAAYALEKKHARTQSTDKIGKARADEQKKAIQCASSHDGSSTASNPRSPSAISPDQRECPELTIEGVVNDLITKTGASTPNFDITTMSDISSLSPHIQFMRNLDWSSTAVGPIDVWSSDLRQAVNLIMACPYPAAMYWGVNLIVFYNEAYVTLAGPKHPWLMGQSYRDGWAEVWELIKPVVVRGFQQGHPTTKESDLLFISRYQDMLEETYFDWALIPILASDGSVAGLYNPAFEQTRRKVSERRMFALQELGNQTSKAQDQKTFWRGLLKGLEYNELDTPFALVYSVLDEVDSDSPQSSINSGAGSMKNCNLEGAIGMPDNHPVLVQTVDLQHGTDYLAQTLRDAMRSSIPTYLSTKDGTLDPDLLKDIKGRGFDDPCSALVVCPIFLPNGSQPMGFLITGVNSRRPYDDDYRLYLSLLSRQAATSMASIVLYEEEIAKGKRAAKAAAKQQDALSQQLRITSEQAAENEVKFTMLTELNPVGLFIADPHGNLTYCNEKWYETMGVTESEVNEGQWMNSIVEEDRGRFVRAWVNLIKNGTALDAEIRLETAWTHHSGVIGETWALAKAKPNKDAAGNVKSILGCITDISQQKWAEHYEKQRMEEAVIRKQEQEQFIDMTSHEMRNPLSSILQCADEINKAALEQLESGNLPPAQVEVMELFSTVSNTLSVCGQHEKRIVDDILTLSKMEAGKLKVSPEAVDPKELIERAQTMFMFDVKYHKIKLDVRVDKSFDDLGVKYVNLDPSRVLAVLVNLTTNSIKFTSKEKLRRMTITLSASLEPAGGPGSVKFVPVQQDYGDPTDTPLWGDGEAVYIHYSVSDTGKGLDKHEINNLFRRFSQASDKTHVTYGGSGLGLFIARLLAEIHGGQIGVASVPGKGSTFAFYVKARRTAVSPPPRNNKDFTKPDKPINILLVEDNEIVAATAARNLKKAGCNVHLAEHGVECLDQLCKSTLWKDRDQDVKGPIAVDVVLMDQEMPVMDGLTCAKEIRRLEKEGKFISHVPIIATTANARAEQLEVVLEAGMDDVVSKPFTMADLFQKMIALMKSPPVANSQ